MRMSTSVKFYTGAKDIADPEVFKKRVTRAAHIVAAAAERDMRGLVPKASGRLRDSAEVDGRKVTWASPYAGSLFYGVLKVDPTFEKGGFPYPNYGPHFLRSRKGVKKVVSGRPLHYKIGISNWINEGKSLYGDRWLKMAKEALLNGK